MQNLNWSPRVTAPINESLMLASGFQSSWQALRVYEMELAKRQAFWLAWILRLTTGLSSFRVCNEAGLIRSITFSRCHQLYDADPTQKTFLTISQHTRMSAALLSWLHELCSWFPCLLHTTFPMSLLHDLFSIVTFCLLPLSIIISSPYMAAFCGA